MARRLRSKRILTSLPGLVAVVLVLGGIAVLVWYNWRSTGQSAKAGTPTSTISYSPASPADNSETEQRKGQPPVSASPAPVSPGTSNGSIAVQLTGANVQAGNVHIGTLVNGATAGSCVLTASKVGQRTLELGASNVRLNVSNYDCGVFNVPTSAFPAAGTWQLLLSVTNGTAKGNGTYDVTIP